MARMSLRTDTLSLSGSRRPTVAKAGLDVVDGADADEEARFGADATLFAFVDQRTDQAVGFGALTRYRRTHQRAEHAEQLLARGINALFTENAGDEFRDSNMPEVDGVVQLVFVHRTLWFARCLRRHLHRSIMSADDRCRTGASYLITWGTAPNTDERACGLASCKRRR